MKRKTNNKTIFKYIFTTGGHESHSKLQNGTEITVWFFLDKRVLKRKLSCQVTTITKVKRLLSISQVHLL